MNKNTTAKNPDIAKYKLIKEVLHDSEERFRIAMESVSDCVWEWDIEKASVDWFGDIDSLLGYKRDEFPRTIAALRNAIHPEDHDKVMVLLYKHIADQTPYDAKYRVVKKDGSIAFWVDRGTVLRDENGKAYKMIGAVKDITKSERTTEALRDSEERFRSLVEKILDVIIVTDKDFRISYISPSYRTVLNRDPSELFGKSALDFVTEFVHQDDVKKIMQAFEDCLKMPNAESQVEFRFRSPDGGWLNLEAIGKNQLDNPSIQGLVATIRDITERKRAEEALQESEERFRTLIEKATDAIIIMDLSGKVLYGSTSFERITGYKLEDWIGKPMGDWIIHPDDLGTLASILEDVLRKPDRFVEGVTVRFKHKDGSWHILEATVRNLLQDPKVNGLVINYHDITERKRAEEALRESQEKYRDLVENLSDIVFYVNVKGSITYVSPVVEPLTGYTPNKLLNTNFIDYVYPEDIPIIAGRFTKVLSGNIETDEVRFNMNDGAVRWMRITARPMFDDNNKVIGAIGILYDITERKRIEEALRETEERYKSLFDRSLEAIYISDLNGNFIDANPYAKKLMGYEGEDITSLNFLSLLDKEYLEKMYKNVEDILKIGHQKENAEYRLVRKDGKYVWVETEASLLYKNGKPVGIQGIARDITERKQAEEALRARERYFRAIMDLSSGAVLVLSSELNILDVTGGLERISGYNRDKTIGASAIEFVHPEEIEKAVAVFTEASQNAGKTVSFDVRLKNAQGAWQWTGCMITDLLDHPDVRGFVAHLVDITERKQSEKELLLYKDHLEELVKERTEELDRAKITAEKANKAKSEFLANMSHEIRTPLSSIIGFSELLYDEMKGPLNDDQKKYLSYVASSGQHLLSLINDILDLSKVEAGKMELQPTTFSISDLLKNSFSFIVEKALKHNIRLISDISANVDMIEADERKVKQIVYNLILNSVKFTPDGGSITIGADIVSHNSAALPINIRKDLTDTEYVLVSVKDTGIGIAKRAQSKLFTEFYQLENPYTKKYEGTGLGLALSKNLVTLHGGKIWLESKGKGKGSTFYFILPLRTLTKA